ncbi:MAG: RidA family protein [Betaproteobacteria bacterium]|nr:RidA family protein [Betaproteobacteria bacterium]
MTRKLISSGSAFEKVAGYSRAVVDGDWVHVSGTTGFDYAKMTISPDTTEQTRQAFRNIEAALEQVGMSLRDAIRVRYFLTRREDFELLAPVFGEYLGEVRPAISAIVCELVDARMKIEIEVTARRESAAPSSPRKRQSGTSH